MSHALKFFGIGRVHRVIYKKFVENTEIYIKMHAQFINIAKLIPTNIDTFHRIHSAIHRVLLAGNGNKYLQRLAIMGMGWDIKIR